jgi:hypothetical protein
MINWREQADITWLPAVTKYECDWLIIDKIPWPITKWHHFDDFGQTIETVTAKKDDEEIEVYSMDEGLTWHTEL